MSTMKLFVNFSLLLVLLQVFAGHVEGIPLKKSTSKSPQRIHRNITKIHPTKPTRLTKKPNGRDARFLGKFTLLAGLGLPDPSPASISHRDDVIIVQNQQPITPTPYIVTHNFPPIRWGPYVAAVYEPSPIITFFENNWNYLAAMLNPYNWFGGGNNGNDNANSPEIVSTIGPDDQHDDIVVIVNDADNEISNDDSHAFQAKIEMKMEQDHVNHKQIQKVMNAITSESMMTAATLALNPKEMTDLVAEETTSKLVRTDPQYESEGEYEPYSPMVVQSNTEGAPVAPPHNRPQTITSLSDSSTITDTPTEETSTIPNTTVTEITTLSTSGNMGMNVTNHTSIITPKPHITHPSFHNGYYYGGYPQNISHVEFTTPPAVTMNTINPARIFNFNSIDYPNNYYQQQNQPSFDYYNRVDEMPSAEPINFHRNGNELSSSFENNFDPHGFKPSFPLFV